MKGPGLDAVTLAGGLWFNAPGELADPRGNGNPPGQPFRFAGEQWDYEQATAGLVFLRARSYDPDLGRFLQRDPLAGAVGSPQSLNRYSYARNNPTTLTDPSGLCVDPGGPGIRYCIQRFIPFASILGNAGDFRENPASNGGSFRTAQYIYQRADGTTTERHEIGTSSLAGIELSGFRSLGGAVVKSRALSARCGGGRRPESGRGGP